MLKLENSIRGLSFSRVAFDLTIQELKQKINNNMKILPLEHALMGGFFRSINYI